MDWWYTRHCIKNFLLAMLKASITVPSAILLFSFAIFCLTEAQIAMEARALLWEQTTIVRVAICICYYLLFEYMSSAGARSMQDVPKTWSTLIWDLRSKLRRREPEAA